MRITEIHVEKLFGLYDYTIPFNLDERVTIIIGPNGFGKTTLLRMIDGIFNAKFSIFSEIPFKLFAITLEDKSIITIKPKKSDTKGTEKSIYFSIKGKQKELSLSDLMDFSDPELTYFLGKTLFSEEERRLVFPSRYRRKELIENVDLFLSKYKDFYLNNFEHNMIERIPMRDKIFRILNEYLDLITGDYDVKIHFIETQRLVNYFSKNAREDSSSEAKMVKMYSRDIVDRISEKLTESTEVTQRLDSSFPKRVMSRTVKLTHNKKSFDELLSELKALKEKREQLNQTGILLELDTNLDIDQDLPEETKNADFLAAVLSIYVEDTKKKLEVFDELSDKIEKLKNIINERFSHKEMNIDKNRGFVFTTDTGEIIFPESLSSGEQHELVIFYQMLFEIPEGSLVLIDEPELSFHIEWQLKFLDDILAIADLSGFDVLVATHSENIINRHWDLTFDLGEKNVQE